MFTIIIPTHERHGVLLRSIDYYQHFNCNIVIADSSVRELDCIFPDNVIYRHLPDLSFAKKILKVAESVTTPYVCMSADDDYLLESSLQESVRFLEENPDFVSAQGRYLRLALIEEQVVFGPRYGRETSSYAVTDEDSFSRVVKAFNPYMHHIYSIHRTDIFIKSFRPCVDISFESVMVELTSILVSMCYGKHKVLPILWMVRDSHQFPRPDAYKKKISEESNRGLISQVFRNHNHLINVVESFLDSEESQLVKKKFASNISDLVSSEKESEKIYNAAFKSFMAWIAGNRNKVIIKNIIKLIIPNWLLNYYVKTETANHAGGGEAGSPDKEALEKIRFSVLSFARCYNENK